MLNNINQKDERIDSSFYVVWKILVLVRHLFYSNPGKGSKILLLFYKAACSSELSEPNERNVSRDGWRHCRNTLHINYALLTELAYV